MFFVAALAACVYPAPATLLEGGYHASSTLQPGPETKTGWLTVPKGSTLAVTVTGIAPQTGARGERFYLVHIKDDAGAEWWIGDSGIIVYGKRLGHDGLPCAP